jgi:predicted DNA-binding transcriptional regulator YafY
MPTMPPVRNDGHVIPKAERLTNLVAALLDVREPLTLRQIVDPDTGVPGYPAEFASARVQFERDKRELREDNVEIENVGSGDDARYRIDPKSYYLPDLGLTEEEAVALNLAASNVRLEGHDPDEALLKLDGFGVDGHALVALPFDARLPKLYAAVRDRALARFSYHDIAREIAPYGLLCRDGFWYVAGDDRTRPGRKNFRVDRIDGDVEVGAPGAFERPLDFSIDAALPVEPYALTGDEPVDVEVWLDRIAAARITGEKVTENADGSVIARIRVSNRGGFRSWLLGLRDHARVVAPPEIVEDVASWLRRMAEAG